MVQSPAQPDKQAKREAKTLLEEARGLQARGDYRGAKQVYARALATAADSDVGRQATDELQQFTYDRWAVYAGLGFLALLVLAWLISL